MKTASEVDYEDDIEEDFVDSGMIEDSYNNNDTNTMVNMGSVVP